MNAIINEHRIELNRIFETHKVSNAFVFGSALSNDFNAESDIDFIINFQLGIEPLERGELWWSLYYDLKKLFCREIDLITEKSLKNPYFIEEVKNTKALVYGF